MSQTEYEMTLYQIRLKLFFVEMQYGEFARDLVEIFTEALVRITSPDFSLEGENK